MTPTSPVQGSLFAAEPSIDPPDDGLSDACAPKLADCAGWALFDDDTNPKHRLRIGRRWGEGPTALFVGLNPSTAGAVKGDTTLAKIVGFTHRLTDCRASTVANLYSYIATDTGDMEAAASRGEAIVHPDADQHLDALAREASIAFLVVSGHRLVRARLPVVVDILATAGVELYCLGLTKDGFPLHPSRLPYDRASMQPVTGEMIARILAPKRGGGSAP